MPDNPQRISDAVSIAIALGTALSTVWGYYLTVLIGLAATIGAYAALQRNINKGVKGVVTLAVILFIVVNFISIYSTIRNFNAVVDYISKDKDLGSMASGMKLNYLMLLPQPIGFVLLVIWLWMY